LYPSGSIPQHFEGIEVDISRRTDKKLLASGTNSLRFFLSTLFSSFFLECFMKRFLIVLLAGFCTVLTTSLAQVISIQEKISNSRFGRIIFTNALTI
jgi:hypothetical protein